MATFLYADPHWGHRGIISACDRPFRTASGEPDVRLMNETMRESWNKTVRSDDDVIVLGDFAHKMSEDLRKLFDSLKGRKHLVIGNHDRDPTLSLPWSSPPRDILLASIDGARCVLSHYALRSWPGILRGALNLHGHHHGRLPGNSQSCDIGVDVFGWAPVRLNTIKAHLATLPPLVDPEGGPEPDSSNDGVKP